MEIVNVIEGGFEVGGIVAVSVVLLFFVILAFVGILRDVSWRRRRSPHDGILLSVIGDYDMGLVDLSTNPTPDKYEAIITDFNEVYEQGYEIVDQRGDIYVVKKTEEGD